MCDICESTDNLTFCPSCNETFCPKCFDFTHQSSAKKNHSTTSIDKKQQWTCSSHNKKFDLICTQCNEFVCFDCTIGEHSGHPTSALADANLLQLDLQKEVKNLSLVNREYRSQLMQIKAKLESKLSALQEEHAMVVKSGSSKDLAESCFGNQIVLKEFSTWTGDSDEWIRNSYESTLDIINPNGLLLEVLKSRVMPGRALEMTRSKNWLISAFHAEALLDLFPERGMDLLNHLKMELKNPKILEDKVAQAFVYFLSRDYSTAFPLLSGLVHVPFVQTLLGIMFEKGYHVEVDASRAFQWYNTASFSYFEAKVLLAVCYLRGNGVEKDLELSVKYLRSASLDDHYVRAIHDLAYCYSTGNAGLKQDHTKAFQLFEKAAKLQYPKSQFKMAWCYEKGVGVARSLDLAFKWYKISAQAGDRAAACNLGYCYENGLGCIKSDVKSYEFYLKSAMQGYPLAQHNLGVCYLNGVGVSIDTARAEEWFQKALENGYKK